MIEKKTYLPDWKGTGKLYFDVCSNAIALLVIYVQLISILEIICGYNNARYARLAFLIVIFCMIIISYYTGGFVKRKYYSLLGLTIIVVCIACLRKFSITNMEYLVTYIICIGIMGINVRNYCKTLKKIYLVLMVFSFIYALGVIYQYIFYDSYMALIYSKYPTDIQHYISLMVNKNTFSGFQREVSVTCSYFVISLGAFFCFKNVKIIKRFNLVWLIIIVIGLLLANKRAHTLFTVASIFVVYYRTADKTKRINRVLKIIGGGLIVVVMFYIATIIFKDVPLIQRYIQTFQSLIIGNADDVSTGRMVLWAASWQLFLSNPLIGIGWKATEIYIMKMVGSSIALSTHNVYLQVLTETGVIGAIIIIMSMFLSYSYTWRNIERIANLNKGNSSKEFLYYFDALAFSLFYQTFFLLYCITGCCLYDSTYYVIYFVSIFLSYNSVRNISLKYKY